MAAEPFVLPGTLPLILLGECYHFPGCDLPLRIFEERYRKMLHDALEADRLFGVGVRVSDKGIFPYTTAGLIRSSVLSEDGTSQMILRGLQRVQITGIRQYVPYVIAEITPVQPVAADPAEVAAFREMVFEALEHRAKEVPEVIPLLKLAREESEADRLCDLLAFHLVTQPMTLQQLLAETHTSKRMGLLLEGLRLEF